MHLIVQLICFPVRLASMACFRSNTLRVAVARSEARTLPVESFGTLATDEESLSRRAEDATE